MTKRLTIIIWILFFGNLLPSHAQDLIFSQFYNAPLLMNPAFAGTSTTPQFNINSRIQWPGFGTPYKSFSLGYSQFFQNIESGVGFYMNGDDSGNGTLKHLEIGGAYMYRMRLSKNIQMRIGLEIGIDQYSLDWNKLLFSDQIDSANGPILFNGVIISSDELQPESLSKTNIDIGTGLLVFSNRWYSGLSIKHLNSPNYGFAEKTNSSEVGQPILINFHLGHQLILQQGNNRNKATFLSPSLILAKQGNFYQVNLGVHAQIRNLLTGVYARHTVRNQDSLIFAFGYALDKLKLSYSFDMTISSLNLSSGGSHEVGVLISLDKIGKEKSKLNDCFMLFR